MHRAPRADRLVGALADALAVPMPDPLAPEVVAVPSRGIERWISQELAARLGTGELGSDGVCANVEFPFPGRLIRDAVARGSGITPERDPWLPERLTWPLLAIVEEDPTAPRLGPLRAHVGGHAGGSDDGTDDGGTGLARRLGAVRHVADLFDRYGVHRPAMIRRWREGDDVGPEGADLPSRHRWQPQLWRAVSDRVGAPSFAERHGEALDALRGDGELLDLPPRLAMFGLTALPATYLEVVAALGAHRDLHLLLLHPSRDLWEQVHAATAATRAASAAGQALPLRDADPTADLPANPLLRSWGRDVRELQLVTPVPDDTTVAHHDPVPPDATPDRAPTLLERLQAAVRDDVHPGSPTGEGRPPLDPADRSVQLHDCHGRLRQVEVLRDAILHLLAVPGGPELRDVIVMCPDIEAFAPLITAVFGAEAVLDDRGGAGGGAEGHGASGDGAGVPADAPPALRVRLADRSLRGTNPVLEVVAQVLDLVDGRVTASDVLDLAAREPVRERFGFAEDDLGTLESWVDAVQVRWGFDGAHRQRQGLPDLDAHTWRAGLQRLLLGVAMADEDLRMVEGVVPFDGLEGQASDLAGRFVELVARLADVLDDLAAPRPIDGWRDAIGATADRLTATDADTAWQRLQLHRVLDELVDDATTTDGTSPVELTLAEVRTVLAERLAGRPTTSSHRTGDLTFSTLVPMRSVPHRVVCLLGLDDGAFPRTTVADSDDLLATAPRVGDRDARSEDRQLLLDALLAATETLVVTWAGRDVRTNEDRPPAVPVDELLDVIDRTVASPDEDRPRTHLVTRHRLAEHDHRNFTPGGLGAGPRGAGDRPWSFDPSMLAAATAARAEPVPVAPFLTDPLPPPDDDVIELDDLVGFLEHPAKAFVKQRLELTLPTDGGDDAGPSDRIATSLQRLDAWKVGDPVVQAWRDGLDTDRVVEVLRARGLVPPGALATGDLDRILRRVDSILDLCRDVGVGPSVRDTIDVEVDLPDGRQLVGTVPDLVGTTLTVVGYSRVAPKHRLAMWARWVALTAHAPDHRWEAVTVGRHPFSRTKDAQAVQLRSRGAWAQDPAAQATMALTRLVDLYDRGMRSPIPLYCASSAKSAEQRFWKKPPTQYVHYEWETRPRDDFAKEDLDPYHLLVLGQRLTTDELFEEVCHDAEEASWADDHRRFVAYAWRLWEPILQAEWRRQK